MTQILARPTEPPTQPTDPFTDFWAERVALLREQLDDANARALRYTGLIGRLDAWATRDGMGGPEERIERIVELLVEFKTGLDKPVGGAS